MKIEDLKELGIDLSSVEDQVVERIVTAILNGGDDFDSDFSVRIEERVKLKIDEAIESTAGKHVLPNVAQYLEDFCLQKTNEWGDPKGEKITFTEYLVQRAQSFLEEPVDYVGKTKKEGGYGWTKSTTRVAFLIDKHLQYSISNALKDGLATIDKQITGGLKKAVEIKLEELKGNLQIMFDGERRRR